MSRTVDHMEIQQVIGGWIVWDTKQLRAINGPYRWRWMAVVARFLSVGLWR
ncbi:hypothetical protein [Piscinibacter defluvii]|uniref:hypothetical protein n=1 Tax=Piscinibacter defluvii TaxID=1796922 RepID=UPI0013E319D9|nr:hypothetical protein [Piscinibacter defluvii]